MYTEANCTNSDWRESELLFQYLILRPECMLFKNEKFQLVYVTGGSGCSVNSMGSIISVEEVIRNNPRAYDLNRYDSPFIGIANTQTVNYHKERYT